MSQSQERHAQLLKISGIRSRFAVINPGASWASKRWDNQRFGDVAIHLFRRFGIPSVITWAGDEELLMAREIAKRAEGFSGATSIAPQTSLNELASLLAEASCFIGCDTGPMHMATAVGTPCIGLHGPTLPEESGAYGPQNLYLQKRYQSGSCRQRRSADNAAMLEITTADVCLAVDKMIDQQQSLVAVAG